MGNKHLNSSLIPKSVAKKENTVFINKEAALLLKNNNEGDSAFVFTSLRFIQHNYQCFHEWTKSEMREFWNFNSSIHEKTWTIVYGTATKNKRSKSGLAYTTMAVNKYPNPEFKKQLSPDITIFELRVSRKIRVHGFRADSIFYICWLDKGHSISDK
jgi:hypothetical protein